jgi:hypothetical protein
MAEEQQTHTDNDITTDLLPQTGEQAYALIEATYGLPLKATTFGGVLQGKRGTVAPLACLLLEWCLDWYRPRETGKRYRGEMPYLDSADLAADWHASPREFKTAREIVSRSGLVTFESRRHDCRVRIHWDAVAEAVRREAEFRQSLKRPSSLDSRQSDPLTGLDSRQSDPLTGLDSRQSDYTLPLISSFIPSSFAEEEAETNEERVERMLDYGRKAGRSCDRKWVKDAHEAFDAVVADGHDPALVERAWYAYVDERGKAATDLGHWLRGLNLRGEEADEGEWSFTACYERAKHRAEREAERERVAAGGMPRAQLRRTKEGWVELVSGFVVAPEDATAEEAEEAWPGVWEANKSS